MDPLMEWVAKKTICGRLIDFFVLISSLMEALPPFLPPDKINRPLNVMTVAGIFVMWVDQPGDIEWHENDLSNLSFPVYNKG